MVSSPISALFSLFGSLQLTVAESTSTLAATPASSLTSCTMGENFMHELDRPLGLRIAKASGDVDIDLALT